MQEDLKQREMMETIEKLDQVPQDGAPMISISKVIEMIQEPFDQIGVATKTFEKHYDDDASEYYHMSIEEICNKWSEKGNESKRYGAMLDEYIGHVLNKEDEDLEIFNLDYDRDGDKRLDGICSSFDDFIKDWLEENPSMVFVAREKNVYLKINNPLYKEGSGLSKWIYIRGRFDALFYDTDKKRYVIVDWKSSDSVDKKVSRWTTNLLGPMKAFPSLNWYTYTMQVYFYKTSLESEAYSIGDVDCIIVQLPGKIVTESMKRYCVHKPAFQYDKDLMLKTYEYAYKKSMLLDNKKKKSES